MTQILELDASRNGSGDIRSRFISRVKSLDSQFLQGNVMWAAEGGDCADEAQSLITESHLDRNNHVLRRLKVRLAPTLRDAGVSENCAEQFTSRRVSFQNDLSVNTRN